MKAILATDRATVTAGIVGSMAAQLARQAGAYVIRVREGRLRTNIGNIATLGNAVDAFNPTKRIKGKTIIRVRP